MTAFAIITARMKSMKTTLMSITTEPPINLSRSSTLETGLCANRDSIPSGHFGPFSVDIVN